MADKAAMTLTRWNGQRKKLKRRQPEKAEVTDIVGLPEKFKIQIKRRGLKKGVDRCATVLFRRKRIVVGEAGSRL